MEIFLRKCDFLTLAQKENLKSEYLMLKIFWDNQFRQSEPFY